MNLLTQQVVAPFHRKYLLFVRGLFLLLTVCFTQWGTLLAQSSPLVKSKGSLVASVYLPGNRQEPAVQHAFHLIKNYATSIKPSKSTDSEKVHFILLLSTDSVAWQSSSFGWLFSSLPKKPEGYVIYPTKLSASLTPPMPGVVQPFSAGDHLVFLIGSDPNGLLYGAQTLMEEGGTNCTPSQLLTIPPQSDFPEMVLRGACIGLQKPYYLPGRTVYEYPITPETFPWFYDKNHWVTYLDSLLVNRMNTLYLWNGHPFASLVQLQDYPYALEVSAETFQENKRMYRFIAEEAAKRGIWVIQMFYNIIVSKPFAEKHGIKTQERERPITPLIADYTKKSIEAFVAEYPNVGLLVTLGEAMEGVGQDDIEWFTKTIIPGVQAGLKKAGITKEPPLVLRAHDTDAPQVIAAAKGLYSNLYTMAKFNGEALTTYMPRGKWANLHRNLSASGAVHVQNVHILANLEPFRYAAMDFIQKSTQSMHTDYHANGLHLYPQASYWDWPYSADKTPDGKKLLQIERDWLWYRMWARYAWNCHRNPTAEQHYWSKLLADYFGLPVDDAHLLMKAMDYCGEISPKLLRRFGITDGNRQTLTLGMQMSQLINPNRFGLFTLLYESEAPIGERLPDFVHHQLQQKSSVGETPRTVIDDVRKHAQQAVALVQQIKTKPTQQKEEFQRWINDIFCYEALAEHYAFKAEAALYVLRFKQNRDLAELEAAKEPLKKSVEWYQKLTERTAGFYDYANSMQTQQRKIPFRGVDATFIHWKEVLPFFQREYQVLLKRIDSLKKAPPSAVAQQAYWAQQAKKSINSVQVKINGEPAKVNFLQQGVDLSSFLPLEKVNGKLKIQEIMDEIKGLPFYSIPQNSTENAGRVLEISGKDSVHLLVGYFRPKSLPEEDENPNDFRIKWLAPPQLETNAQANLYGQAEPVLPRAILLEDGTTIQFHQYSFPPGKHVLQFEKGIFLVGGALLQPIRKPIDGGLTPFGKDWNVDWLFEDN